MADNYSNDNFMYSDQNTNRAYDTRRDNDTFITPSINLYDIDYAILYHLKNNIAFEVEENGKMIPVPVMFAGGETWSQIQRHGYLRDKTRKILTPIITIRRSSMLEDDRFSMLEIPGRLGANRLVVIPDRQNHDIYDHLNGRYQTKDTKQYFLTVIPEYVRITYDLFIWTELTVQMNSIIEKLLPQNKLLWGDSFKFLTGVTDFTFETINDTGQDRLVRSQITLIVDGRLREEYRLKRSNLEKAYSTKRVDFMNEVEEPELYVTPPKIIRSAKSRLPSRDFEK